MIQKVRGYLVDNRTVLLYVFGITVVSGALFLYKLGSFVPVNSIYETKNYLGIESLKTILENISFGPVKIAEFGMTKIDDPNSVLLRLISVFIVLLTLLVFYRVVSKWYTHRIALLATLLLATSSYTLHLGRFTNQDALYYFVVPALLLFGTWLKSRKYVTRLPIIFPVLCLLLYLPGFIYLIILLPIIFRKRLLLAWRHVDVRKNIVSLAVSILMLVPLAYSLIMYSSQIKQYFALDRILGENGLTESLRALGEIPRQLFYTGPDEPYRWLVGTPILDIASVALLVLGIYGYFRGPHTLRARLLLLFTLVSLIIMSTGTMVTIAIVLPLLYIVIANGLVYLLQSWFVVFPRNPAARNTAIAIMAIFIALICSYQLQRYFIAWPNAPETKAALKQNS